MKKLRCCFLMLIVVAVLPFATKGQQSFADSLIKRLPLEKNDSNKIMMLRNIGFEYMSTDTIKCRQYLVEAMALAKKTNNVYQQLGSLMDFGSMHVDMGKYDTAEIIYKSIIANPNSEKYYRSRAGALSNLATLYVDQEKYVQAQPYYLQAIEIYEKNNDSVQLSISYGNICNLYTFLKQYQNTIKYAQKLYAIAIKKNDKISIVNALENLSAGYSSMGDYPKSFSYLSQTLPLAIEVNNPNQLFHTYGNFGDYYFNIKEYNKAIPYLIKADSIAKIITNKRRRATNLCLLGNAYAAVNDFKKAKIALQEAEQILVGNDELRERKELYLSLAKVEKKLGNTDKAYGYLTEYVALADSFYDAGNSAKIAELEINYQTAKKEKDILLLQQESKNKTDSIQKSKMFSYVLLGSFLTLLLISFLSYRTYKQKQLLQHQQIKQLQNEKLLLATESILKGQEDERSRMAQDLHDGLGGMLSGVKLTLGAMKGNIILSEESGRLFSKAFEQLDSSIGEMRRVAHNMMPEALVKLGLQQALQDYCDGINEHKQIDIKSEFHGLENRLEASTEIIVYRIVQELINNIIKHAGATKVLVQVMRNDAELNITVEDDGKGFNKEAALLKNGAGLKNIQSRVDYLKGHLDIKSAPGKGTSVQIDCTV
jgi:two-component system, NarL family, sensor kinase